MKGYAFHFYLYICEYLQANKIGKINLAATGKDLMDDEKQGDVTIDLFAALDMETEAVGERSTECENNQTLGLLTGFLSVNDWYVCLYLGSSGSQPFPLNDF